MKMKHMNYKHIFIWFISNIVSFQIKESECNLSKNSDHSVVKIS